MSHTEPTGPTPGPVRQKAMTATTAVFVVLLVVMLLLGAVLVLSQIAGLVAVSGGFVSGAWDVLSPWVFGTAALLGMWTLLLAYVHGYKPGD
ncbi:hypothetical protein [Prauserella cavernicola]|uniref:Uncharacterized protein n=1 Tax=Prauserella cavernicola TaxID=2800127 RepID=A0A934QQW1_9PSEU|nr:hypothetical protein [Prauserella cavernicola]MBK1783749.1 hypothetical protein [Prauserella cavernicola]